MTRGAGTYNLTSAGSSDIFISEIDSNGNFRWAARLGSTGTDKGYGTAVDASQNIYTTGFFSNTVDFDPGSSTYNLTGICFFVQKLSQSGSLPVSLLNFSAKLLSGQVVQLQGQTVSEINTSHFKIERNSDCSNFSNVGKVAASENSATIKN